MRIIAVVGQEASLVREYERMGFSELMLLFITRRFAPHQISPKTMVSAKVPMADAYCDDRSEQGAKR